MNAASRWRWRNVRASTEMRYRLTGGGQAAPSPPRQSAEGAAWEQQECSVQADTRHVNSNKPASAMRGYRGVKYTLFICCYVLWVVSAVLTAVGIYAKVAKEKDVVDTLTIDPALLLIVVGSAVFLITFFGCFGALRNVTCLLKAFLGILVVVVLLQVAAGIVSYLFTDMVMERTEKLMMKAIIRYREDQDLENAIDFIQKKFQCCGVEGYKDWSHNIYFQCSEDNPSLEACGVPFSCCVGLRNQTVLNTMCGYGMQEAEGTSAALDVFTVGCLEKIVRWAKHNLLLVAGLTGGLLLLELCMICLAAAQIAWIKKATKAETRGVRSQQGRKDSFWLPAFASFADE
ncbi:tetraspanin-33 [Genypterus blacodes]|uniref:tetraspanin-33 n=1 Tax=Genypterus blacodes TaxID=154954 RepID=UPI003F76D046